LYVSLSAAYLAGEVPHCCFSLFTRSQDRETKHLKFMIGWSTNRLRFNSVTFGNCSKLSALGFIGRADQFLER